MLLDPLEEQLDMPTILVERTDGDWEGTCLEAGAVARTG